MRFVDLAAISVFIYSLPIKNLPLLKLPFFHPPSITNDLPKHTEPHLLKRDLNINELLSLAKQSLSENLNISENDMKISHYFIDSYGVSYFYANRIINGIAVINQNAQIYFKNGQAIRLSTSFSNLNHDLKHLQDVKKEISIEVAAEIAMVKLGAPKDDQPSTLIYVQTSSGKLVYAYRFQVRNDAKGIWYQVSIDVYNGILSLKQ
jgi:extracellular elastinolytic metalloproteinase